MNMNAQQRKKCFSKCGLAQIVNRSLFNMCYKSEAIKNNNN